MSIKTMDDGLHSSKQVKNERDFYYQLLISITPSEVGTYEIQTP